MSNPPVIMYRYDASPFCHKVDNILTLKKIPHQRVNVSSMLPRPEITELLGITYRRIPILAIGNDVYCDSSLIATALERRFPSSAGYGTIYPPRAGTNKTDIGLINLFSKFYADNVLFPPATNLIAWDKIPAVFLKDRSALRGAPIDPAAITAARPLSESVLTTHLINLESQLADGRTWLLDTSLPSLADLSVHFVLAWGKSFKGTDAVFDKVKFPKTLEWIDRVTAHIQSLRTSQPAPTKLKGPEAAEIIVNATASHEELKFDDLEGERLKLKKGDSVLITPDDNARNYPTKGTLLGLTAEECVVQVKGSKGLIRVHFPRFGFVIRKGDAAKL
ncbi:hypothetical protein CVT24_001751 [Panaeolus cyanescens]|uniref:GST N-terminal domain-containing protein n=1 Tax=Panaeolus cyanescens TaxID=181874 RepID=A0A409YU99_9AGAR|nr:hypothetical protein CVT24_001751 [Panaeolus cyanescens]